VYNLKHKIKLDAVPCCNTLSNCFPILAYTIDDHSLQDLIALKTFLGNLQNYAAFHIQQLRDVGATEQSATDFLIE
jgi:hypothetical protein